MNTTSNIAQAWFAGLNNSDMPQLLKLFSPDGAYIRNAAQPAISGPEAPQRLLEEFFARTESRHFAMIDYTINETEIVAAWHGILTFRAGIQIADVTLAKPLSVVIRGVDRFVIAEGRIVELAIDHETTTVVQAARAATMRELITPNPAHYEAVVRDYFAFEEAGNIEGVVALCDPSVVVRNAAQPVVVGLAGVRQYVESFRDRTTFRVFEQVSISTAPGLAYATWKADLEFKAGTAFGPVISKTAFPLTLQGVCRFVFNASGKLVEIDVYHETTSALRRAQEAI